MRHWSVVAVTIALAAIAPQTVMAVGAGAVSVVLEALPYLAVAAALAPLAGRYAHTLIGYAGCGCGAGPSARSIPAALATAAIFGAPVAIARVALATLVARLRPSHDHVHGDLLSELQDLIPAALLAAVLMPVVPLLPLRSVPPALLVIGGALLGLVASPCALGAIAIAASLRVSAPLVAIGVLSTAGMLPSFFRWHRDKATHDALAYLLLGAASGIVAAHHGGGLVHPRMTIPLAASALYCVCLAWRARHDTAPASRLIAGAALAVVIIGAPAPSYRATETTLADAFPGEHVDFTGVAVTDHTHSSLVRYAITCCRADAAPVALALDRSIARYEGRWMRASGVIEAGGGVLRLRVAAITQVTPPRDPFVYR
jgi:DUF1980 C-terminal domain